MSKIFIADGNNWAHRGFHAMKNMSYNGRGTGAIFGFLNILGGNAAKFKPKKMFICWDDEVNPKRREILPGYKMRDPKLGMDYKSFHKQKATIQLMCYFLGIPQCFGKQCEADDFIYTLTKKYGMKVDDNLKLKHKLVIGSGDKDFRQLVKSNVLIQDENKGLITPLNFKKHFDIIPAQYADLLCLTGDSSDKIPGVPGFGDKTALKFLHLYYSYYMYILAGEKDKATRHPKHEILIKTWQRNQDLIDLKQFDDKYGPFPLQYYKNEKKPDRNVKKFKKLCVKYGIKKFATDTYIDKIPCKK